MSLRNRSSNKSRSSNRATCFENLESRRYFAIVAIFQPTLGTLTISGDELANSIVVSRTAGGTILVNNGAVAINGGTSTVANTALITVQGAGGENVISFGESNGGLPAGQFVGGEDGDTITGGSGNDTINGNGGNDVLLGMGGTDQLFGGIGNDTLTGGAAADSVFGEADADRLVWNPGDDNDLNEGGTEVDTVEVNGGNDAEVFTATANGTRVRFDRISPEPFFLDIGTAENLVVNANSGNDTFSATGNLSTLIQISVDGGAGNDTLLGSNGADTLLGGDDNDFIDGNQGSDTALLGAGADTFQWDPGDGSDVVEGQADADTMLFNGSAGAEIFDLSANGSRLRFTRNLGSIVMDVDDVETVTCRTLGAVDSVNVNDLAGTDVTQVNVQLAGTVGGGTGDAVIDTITLRGTSADDTVDIIDAGGVLTATRTTTNISVTTADAGDVLVFEGSGGTDTLNFNGTSGPDALQVTSSLTAGRATLARTGGTIVTDTSEVESVNLRGLDGNDTIVGNGNLGAIAATFTYDGGAGSDTLLGGNSADMLMGGDDADFIDGNQGTDTAFMGGGNDTFNWDPGDGNDVVEGQEGSDTLQFNGSNTAEVLDLSAVGAHLRLTRNVGNIVMDADDVETVSVRALGGADVITMNNLTGTDVALLNLDLATSGNQGDAIADQVIVVGATGADSMQVSGDATNSVTIVDDATTINVTKHEPTLDSFLLRGLGGADTFAFNSLIGIDGTPITVDLTDGAADQVILNFDGSNNAITVSDSVGGTSIAGLSPAVKIVNADAALDSLRINAGAGSDNITINQSGEAGSVRKIVIDAGDQTDTLQIANTAPDGVATILPSTGNDNVNVNTDGLFAANAVFSGTQRLGPLNIGTNGHAELEVNGASVLTISSLIISGTGKLDLQNNAMIVDYTSGTVLPTIATMIRNARNDGAWNGNGITSSAAASANPANTSVGAIEASQFKAVNGGTTTFGGEPIDDTAVLMKYTYYGDTDFNGKVDGADYARVDATFNFETGSHTDVGGWFNGDFDGNGKVDGADYALIDAAFNSQGQVLRPAQQFAPGLAR